jgi:hypothetical protein
LLLPYKDPANAQIITQLSKLMQFSISDTTAARRTVRSADGGTDNPP